MNFFAGFIVSSGSYYLLCRFFPVPATSDTWCEVGEDISEITLAEADETFVVEDEETGKEGGKEAKGY